MPIDTASPRHAHDRPAHDRPVRGAAGGGHFAAFSFVDRITALVPGRHAEGHFAIPPDVERFPHAFGIEAAGQLAAWVAMAALDFRVRPVAGVAGGIEFGPPLRQGQVLDLSVDIESCDEEAVRYTAWVHVAGVQVVRLGHSLGPMLPMIEFDDPQAIRERFELLCGAGAQPGRYRGVPPHDFEIVELAPGERMRALLRVPPRETLFFADHFSRKPVFPGTMLLDAHIEASIRAAAGASYWQPDADIAAIGVPDTKIRSFISPGDVVELRTEFMPMAGDGTLRAKTTSRLNGKQIALGGLELADRRRR